MLPFYRIVACSIKEYGSFVHGSETKPMLPVPDPVHDSGIRVVTDAFHASPLDLSAFLL
jgi:hypothetical protein